MSADRGDANGVIVFETVEHQFDAQIKRCPGCLAETRGRFPDSVPGPLQHGPAILAWAVHMLVAQMVSLKRVAQSLKTLTGRTHAEAAPPSNAATSCASFEWRRPRIAASTGTLASSERPVRGRKLASGHGGTSSALLKHQSNLNQTASPNHPQRL